MYIQSHVSTHIIATDHHFFVFDVMQEDNPQDNPQDNPWTAGFLPEIFF